MYFKQITLQKDRQFKEKTTVTFSTDHVKNVTIIMGDNGTGKTSFAQAFTWCLYGRTDFKDQDIFSKSKKAEMTNIRIVKQVKYSISLFIFMDSII